MNAPTAPTSKFGPDAIRVAFQSRLRSNRRTEVVIDLGSAAENSLFALKKAWQLNCTIVASRPVSA